MDRRIKAIYFALVISIFSFTICVGENDNKTTPQPTVSHKGKLERPYNPKWKRAPARDFIEYEYTGSGIMFYPMDRSSVAVVTINGGGNFTNITEDVSEENGYYVETGILAGLYEIQFTTESGIVYSGILEI